jgi:cysteinyl-tRNA synthetase
MVEGQKMSKSLGNFYTLRDLVAKGWSGREIRYALLTVNYRLPLNFTFAGLEAARAALSRIDEWWLRMMEHGGLITSLSHGQEDWVDRAGERSKTEPEASTYPLATQAGFEDALDDDLNISGALGHVFNVIRESNRALDQGELTPGDARAMLLWWNRVNSVLGFEELSFSVPSHVLALVEQRQQARMAKDWKKSDELRDAIAALGWVVKDTKDGPKLTPR